MTNHDSREIETILKVGAEGGSITLQGQRSAQGEWRFRVSTNETALWELLDEEPEGDAPAPELSPPSESWEDALANNRKHIFSLPDDTVLCPGHGPLTSVREEKRNNPFYPELKK